MWKWFKDWAHIARTHVSDKRFRYYMGISQRRHDSGDTVEPSAPENGPAPDPQPTMPAPEPIVSPSPGTPVTV